MCGGSIPPRREGAVARVALAPLVGVWGIGHIALAVRGLRDASGQLALLLLSLGPQPTFRVGLLSAVKP